MKKIIVLHSVIFFLLIAFQSSAQNNIISTIAGNGTSYYSGDGGLATNAQIVVGPVRGDALGNIYVEDVYNNRIRKIDAATGIVHTIAGNGVEGFSGDGGPATSAGLGSSFTNNYICLDNAGNIYLIDFNRIRKIDVATGIIHTIAGTSVAGYSGDGGTADTATFNGPAGIAIDDSNNIYVSDFENNVIRKINGVTNVVTTIAGDTSLNEFGGGFSGDSGLAINAIFRGPMGLCLDNAGNIYIADNGNYRVRKITVSTGIINTIAGDAGYGTAAGDGGLAINATLGGVSDVYIGVDSNLYIAGDPFVVRKVNTAGYISTLAGTEGFFGYNGDGILAVTAQLHDPGSVYSDASGNVLIGDYGNMRIRKVNILGIISTIAGTGYAQFSGDGGPATDAELNYPLSVCADASGNVYVVDNQNNRIRKIDSSGIITTVAGSGSLQSPPNTGSYSGDGGPATSATLNDPQGICIDDIGNLYFADAENYRIRKVDKASGVISTVAGNGSYLFSGDGGIAINAGLGGPGGVGVDAEGNLYITDGARIRKVEASTGIINTIAGNGTLGNSGDGGLALNAVVGDIESLCIGTNGDIYIADALFNVVRKISANTGIINTVAGNGYVDTVLTDIFDSTYSYDGGCTGDDGDAINAELFYPSGIFVDGSGALYIASAPCSAIRAVAPDGIIYAFAGNGLQGFSGDGGPATSAALFGPADVCKDSYGNIYIADALNNRVRKVINPSLAVTNVSAPSQFSVAPNPSSGEFTIFTGNDIMTGIDIYNVIGEKVYHADGGTVSAKINLANQPSGLYVISVRTTEKTMLQKLIIIH